MDRLKELWASEPTRVVAVLTAVAVFVLAKLGVVVDEESVGEALLLVLPVLLGGEAIRSQVQPATVEPVTARSEHVGLDG